MDLADAARFFINWQQRPVPREAVHCANIAELEKIYCGSASVLLLGLVCLLLLGVFTIGYIAGKYTSIQIRIGAPRAFQRALNYQHQA